MTSKDRPNNKPDFTIKDIFDSMSEEQKNVTYFMIGEALRRAEFDYRYKAKQTTIIAIVTAVLVLGVSALIAYLPY